MDRSGRNRFLCAVALLTVTASACGSSSGGASGGGSQTGSIAMGVEGPMTGIYASAGASFWQGARAAADEINSEGGLLGRQLKLYQGDDVDDPGDAIPVINKLIGVNHIVALDGPNSTVLPAVQATITQHKVIDMFQGGSTSFDNNTDPWIWRPSPSDSQLGVAMAAYALSKGYKTAALLFSSIATAQTLSSVVQSTFKKNGGTITSDEVIQPGQSSYRTEVSKVLAGKPQVIFTQVDATSAAPVYNDLQQLHGLSTPFIGSDFTAGSDFIKAITPSLANRVLVSVEGSTNTGAGQASFLKYYGKLYKGAPISGANYSYDAIMEVALAIEKAGSTDPAKIDVAMPEVNNTPGVDVSDWAKAISLIKAGKKIHFVGAGGPSGYNAHHNALGSFDAFRSSVNGKLQLAGNVSPATIGKAESGSLRP
jgi:branched-chain amino acid transport system substrate-binding protein